MIQTTSLELSTRLQELAPGWDDTYFVWAVLTGGDSKPYIRRRMGSSRVFSETIAPDLDWLLGHLPANSDVYEDARHFSLSKLDMWSAGYSFGISCKAETACDAACALLIKLIETGELKV